VSDCESTNSWDHLTVDDVLDTPVWNDDLKVANFASLTSLEDFVMRTQDVIQQELLTHDYNTFTPFAQFYKDYRKASERQSFLHFVTGYSNLTEEKGSLSCVGLSLSLIERVRKLDSKYADCITLVSCEEVVKDVGSYTINSPNNLKEHVMVAMKIGLEEKRDGFILMDPGYHVSRPVVIMKDQKYPHTGWFIQSKTSSMTKEYCYDIIDEHFLSWTVRETRNGMAKQWTNLIFIKKNFERALTITKKRSLLYAFKSYVVRDRKGPIAGIYCCIRSHSITVFYNREGEKVQVKFPITGR